MNKEPISNHTIHEFDGFDAIITMYFRDGDDFPIQLFHEFDKGMKLDWNYLGFGYFTLYATENNLHPFLSSDVAPIYASFHPGDFHIDLFFNSKGNIIATDCRSSWERGEHFPLEKYEIVNDKVGDPHLVLFRGNGLPIAVPIRGKQTDRWYRWEKDWTQRLTAELIRCGHPIDEGLELIRNMPSHWVEPLGTFPIGLINRAMRGRNISPDVLAMLPVVPLPKVEPQRTLEAWC